MKKKKTANPEGVTVELDDGEQTIFHGQMWIVGGILFTILAHIIAPDSGRIAFGPSAYGLFMISQGKVQAKKFKESRSPLRTHSLKSGQSKKNATESSMLVNEPSTSPDDSDEQISWWIVILIILVMLLIGGLFFFVLYWILSWIID